jgi:hypothetical protein
VPTQAEMAERIGISASSFSKKASNIGLWSDDEREKLTRIYGKLAPKSAYDPHLTIDIQTRTITALTAENARHVKGLKISLVGAAVFIVGCLTLLVIAYAPAVKAKWVTDAYHDQIKDTKIVELERRCLMQAQVIDDYRTSNKARDDTALMWSEIFGKVRGDLMEVGK